MIRPLPFSLVIAALIAALFLAELALGVVDIPVDAIAASLTGGPVAQEGWGHIVREYRLPRALAALVGGASLGACGLMLQTLFRNPLADPFVLGIAHGARFGVALLVVATGLAGPALSGRNKHRGGIGLHWCANTLNAYGGSITLESDGPGCGSRAEVRLPLASAEAAPCDEPIGADAA